MACILLKKEEILEVIPVDKPTKVDDSYWRAADAISGVEQNVMYYAYDVKAVLSQAYGADVTPVFLKVNRGGSIGTVLALQKNNRSGRVEYFTHAATGWPDQYETVRRMFGPGRIIDFNGTTPFEVK